MCVTFTPATPSTVQRMAGHAVATDYPATAFPGYGAPIIRTAQGSSGATGMQAVTALFGLVPAWASDTRFGRRTYNARCETVATKPSYRSAWRNRQFCLVPMQRFFEPCWETGRAVQWSIHRTDGEPFTVAGIWDSWTDRTSGELVQSFSMLTIHANGHPVMGRFHKPEDEKRSLVVVPPALRQDWLNATPTSAPDYLVAMPLAQFESSAMQTVVQTASLF